MTIKFLYDFILKHKYAVISTVAENMHPEAALIGFGVMPDLKIIFDTVTTSRKYDNLLRNPAAALVIGWENEQTLQYEGIARFPDENEVDEFLKVYFKAFPEGKIREKNWSDIVYFCIEPVWIRYCDFNMPLIINERSFK